VLILRKKLTVVKEGDEEVLDPDAEKLNELLLDEELQQGEDDDNGEGGGMTEENIMFSNRSKRAGGRNAYQKSISNFVPLNIETFKSATLFEMSLNDTCTVDWKYSGIPNK
jgi:hypothetical protein